MSARAAALAPLTLLVLAACASLSEEACRAGDWRGIGFRDGAAGRSLDYVSNHAEACAGVGVTPDVALWRAGRAEGLQVYCTPETAWDAGARGSRLNPVCPQADRAALARANDRGLRYYELGREIERLEAESAALNSQIDAALEGDLDRDGRRLVRAWRDDVARSERLIRVLERERASYFGA